MSTKFVYTHLTLDGNTKHPEIDAQIEAIRQGDLGKISSLCGNVLEDVTIPAHPQIAALKEEMHHCGALTAMMSGSGPTVFGIFEEEEKAQRACRRLRERADGTQVFLTQPYYPGKADPDPAPDPAKP